MRNEAIESIFGALCISFSDDVDHLESVLDRLSQIFKLKDKLENLKEKCAQFQSYCLELKPLISSGNTQSIIVFVCDNDSCREQVTIDAKIVNKIDIGPNRDVSLRFLSSQNKQNEGNKKGLARSASLLKKVIFTDKKNCENLQISNIPIGTMLKKSITLNGRNVNFEMKLVRNEKRNMIHPLDFEDFLEVTRNVHEWQSTNCEVEQYDGNIGDPTFSMLYSIAFFFEIPSFVLKAAEMICFLVWDDDRQKLDEQALIDVNLKMSACESEVDFSHPFLKPCLGYLNECTCDKINSIIDQYSNSVLFPPISHQHLKGIHKNLKIVTDICVLDIWDHFPNLSSPTDYLSSKIESILVTSALKWIESVENLDFLALYKEIFLLWKNLNSECHSYHIFFHQFGINYLKTTISAIEGKLKYLICHTLDEQLRTINSRDPLELESFTKTTMRLFVNLKSITNLIRQFNIDQLELLNFEYWFENISVFWTYSWREVTREMVERTIRLDEDGDSVKYGARRPLPAGLYSFLCIQKGISDDLRKLEFTYPKHLIICSTSVVNILCQNIHAYARKLLSEAMRSHDEKSSRLIRATNGIEQAMCFVEEGYKRFAQFDRLETFVDDKDSVGVYETSKRLLHSTRQTCEQYISVLLWHFSITKMDVISRISRNLCSDGRETNSGLKSYMREISAAERIEGTLECSYGLVDDVRCLLLPNCFKISTKHFANLLQTEIRKYLYNHQPSEYYANIYIAMKYLYEILEIEEGKDVELLSDLHLKSFSTNDLILSYYDTLCEKINRTSFPNKPTVDIHISYSKTISDETITIRIKLIKMSPMEWIDILSDRVDYFIRFDLLPKVLFPIDQFESPTTNTVPQSTRPQWREIFEIKVPLDFFFTRGACLAISVFDHERFVDRLIGRGYISLHSVPCESNNDIPIERLRIPLLAHDFLDQSNVFYQLLKSRSSIDPVAKEFIEMRQRRHIRIGDIRRYIWKNRNRIFLG